MGADVDPWREARLAWARLAAGRADDGDHALAALQDLGVVRRALDAAEFEAVRDARRHGRSWSEIAVRLGVARQSAWERWRNVDEAAPAEPAIAGAARELRQGATVRVPDVVGMSWDVAVKTLRKARLMAVDPDADGPPRPASGWPDGVVVTDQSPESGAWVPVGAPVRLWVDRGGGSGVREPRQPKPDPKTGRKLRDEATDEAVS